MLDWVLDWGIGGWELELYWGGMWIVQNSWLKLSNCQNSEKGFSNLGQEEDIVDLLVLGALELFLEQGSGYM